MSESGYLLDNRGAETEQRFDSLALLFNQVTFRHLERLGIRPGWSCLEVGAGGDSVVRWLSDRVGSSGSILAIDIEPRWLAGLSLPNLEVRQHDIVEDGLPEASFDLAHARLVLGHVPRRDQALRQMVRSVKPGGWLLIEDFDFELQPDACWEPRTADHHLANKVRHAFAVLARQREADSRYGRKLPRLLREQGLLDVGAVGHFAVTGGEAVRRLERANIAQVQDALLKRTDVTMDDLSRLYELFEQPDFEISISPLISAWGRRPE